MKDVVNIGIIGAGWMGRTHAEAYRETDGARLVAVSDLYPNAAEAFRDLYHVDVYPDYHEMLARPDIDIVDICTPPLNHRQLAFDVVDAGKNVSIQKPITLTLEDADAIVEKAQKSSVQVMVSYMFRCAPLTQKAAALIHGNEIGRPLMAYHRMFIPSWRPGPWTWDEEKSGGMIVEMLTHGFDMFRWYFGEVASVYAAGVDGINEGFHDNVSIVLTFKDGTVATIQGSWTSANLFPSAKTEVIGTEGALYIDGGTYKSPVFKLTYCTGDESRTWELPSKGQKEKIEYWVDCIRNDRSLQYCTVQQGRDALEVALAAKQSLIEGRRVELPLGRSLGTERQAG